MERWRVCSVSGSLSQECHFVKMLHHCNSFSGSPAGKTTKGKASKAKVQKQPKKATKGKGKGSSKKEDSVQTADGVKREYTKEKDEVQPIACLDVLLFMSLMRCAVHLLTYLRTLCFRISMSLI